MITIVAVRDPGFNSLITQKFVLQGNRKQIRLPLEVFCSTFKGHLLLIQRQKGFNFGNANFIAVT